MGKGGKGCLRGDAAVRRIRNVLGKDAAVDRHGGPALSEVVQHMVPFVAADADRPRLAKGLSVDRDGCDRLGAGEGGLVVLDHVPAIRKHVMAFDQGWIAPASVIVW